MSTPSTDTLDHIVHFTAPGTLRETSAAFRQLGFTVLSGGQHVDGLTENDLVVLSDGVYLELISFIHPISHYPPSSPSRHERVNHRWANSHLGWIEFCFLGLGPGEGQVADIINARAKKDGSDTVYKPEYREARRRPDGLECKYIVTDPAEKHGHGLFPFFCGDITPRKWRVPAQPHSNVEHPSGALGIAYLRTLTTSSAFHTVSRQLTTVIGHPPTKSDASKSQSATWILNTGRNKGAKFLLSVAQSDVREEMEFVNKGGELGIFEVGFLVERGRRGGVVYTPQAKLVWVPEK